MDRNQIKAKYMDRHPSTVGLLSFFAYGHLPEHLKGASQQFYDLAANMVADVPDSAELSASLRKLLEAKDAFVRAVVEATDTP